MTEPHEEKAGPWYQSPAYRRQIDVQAGFNVGRWFGRVFDRLWVGAAPRHAADYAQLRLGTGVTHILNVADDNEAWTIWAAEYEVAYLRVPAVDDGSRRSDEWFATSTEWAVDALTDPDTVVYVHCLVGSARGPAIAYAIARRLGQSATIAAVDVRRARPLGSHYYLADAEAWVQRVRRSGR